METKNPYSNLQNSNLQNTAEYTHYWAKHSMITKMGRRIILGWSCPLCHSKVDEPFPFCPFCGEPMKDHDKEN